MASKTIRLDCAAYLRLKTAMLPGESFSDTIKRIVKPRFNLKDWLRRIRQNPLSQQAIDAIELQIAQRRRGIHRA
ncbi:MAG: hypothetical protein HZA51_09565 [Planctomycetes bacterium]|nr:hypothetical protein [Planctomycetota bacterium]